MQNIRIARGLLIAITLGALTCAAEEKKHPIGYEDTPKQPHGEWRVHDINRPRPEVVKPATEVDRPPSDAVVLFDGNDLEKWGGTEVIKKDGKVVERKPREARWKVENGYMEANKSGSIYTLDEFGSCQLHVEFATPAKVESNSQGRGNSGVIFFDCYEVQVLDSYDNVSYADGQCAALYGQHPPLVNACRKPGEWQTYDIVFEAPVFTGDKLERPAYVTVLQNGVLVQNHMELWGPTQHKRVGEYRPHPPKGRISLQDHNNPIRYRNIWLREL